MKFVEANKQKNNRGMALVSVLIVITLIGLLGSSILNLSYLAYQRKLVEKRTTENFYANEAVIDTVKAVLQNAAASALSEVDDSEEFADAARTAVEGVYTNAGYTDLKTYLYDYVVNAMSDDSTGTSVKKAISGTGVLISGTEGENDAVYGNGGSFSVGAMEVSDDGTELYIRDVVVTYVNDEGYTSTITTDIVIRSPVYASNENNPLGSYSMMCGDGATFSGNGTGWGSGRGNMTSYLRHEGNIYIGATTSNGVIQSTAATIERGICVEFSGDNVVINGDVVVKGESILLLNAKNIEIKGTVYLSDSSMMLVGPECENLVLNDVVIDGDSFIDGEYYSGTTSQISTSEYFPLTQYIDIGDIHGYFDNEYPSYNNLDRLFDGDSHIVVYDDETSAYYTAAVMSDAETGERYLYYSSNVACSATDATTLTSTQKILFDTSLEQTELVDGYDAEINSVLDVDVLEVYTSLVSPYNKWSPEKSVSEEGVTEVSGTDGKLYVSTVSAMTGSSTTFTYQVSSDSADTDTINVKVNIALASEIENANYGDLALYVALDDIEVTMNSGSAYSGIYLSAKSVTFKNTGGGLAKGTSFLSLDTSEGYVYAKQWCKQIGLLVSFSQGDANPESGTSYTYSSYPYYYRLVNNIFIGGYKTLYQSLDDSDDTGGSTIITEDNSDTNFVDTENWSRE